MMDSWLIRTAENWIAGPYSAEQVRELVRKGKLGLQDEVCSSGGYWIFLHEREELQAALGIQVPRAQKSGDDVTETETEVMQQEARAATGSDALRGSQVSEQAEGQDQSGPDQTSMIHSHSLQEIRGSQIQKALAHAARQAHGLLKPRGAPAVERPSMVRLVAFALLCLSVVIAVMVVRLLR